VGRQSGSFPAGRYGEQGAVAAGSMLLCCVNGIHRWLDDLQLGAHILLGFVRAGSATFDECVLLCTLSAHHGLPEYL